VVTVHRREILGGFGVGAAATLLWAFGCRAQLPAVRRAPQVSRDVRSWLHDAVGRLAAVYPSVHALAVSRRRTTAALDVIGPGFARLRGDGAVLTVGLSDGTRREHVTSELTADGIDAAVQALGAPRQAAAIDAGPTPATPDEPPAIDDRDLRHRLELLQTDARPSSRIVYAAALIDIDDAIVWSVAPGRDLEQRLVRVRQAVTRAAWNGNLPVVATAEHAWSGWLDDQPLTPADIAAAGDAARKLMTPGTLDDGERTVVLDPSVVAIVLDTLARGRLTAAPGAPRGPEPRLASAAITVIDDPTAPASYGGFAFDDEGEPAAALTLVDAGRITGRLADRATGGTGRGRRPGHLARLSPASSHLQLVPGAADPSQLYTDGLVLEAGLAASFDPGSDRIRIACGRARELRAGNATGRVYADVELVGSLTALLTAADAVATTPASFAIPSAADRDPTWRSISTPALRTRGLVRARRPRS
jgi:predicted Zn-dependent protease